MRFCSRWDFVVDRPPFSFHEHFQLSPTDKSIQIDWESDLDDAKEYVRKMNVISINNNNKEPEAEVEKEENDVNKIFSDYFIWLP